MFNQKEKVMKSKISIIVFLFCANFMMAQDFGPQQQWEGSSNNAGDIYRYGDVGIGLINPDAELHLAGDDGPQLKIESNQSGNTSWVDLGISTCNGCFSSLSQTGDVVLRAAPLGSKNFLITNPEGGNIILGTGLWNNEIASMTIDTNGNVGIGTSSFVDGSDIYKLSVDGRLRADAVKVYTTWADFVFEADYELPTLSEVEAHIAKFGHLKDIPSAAEVEANGIELGEMNKLLLQKIEELTLYVIEMKKEIEVLKKN